MRVRRLPGNPVVAPDMDARMGSNVNGPSLIRVPDWVDRPRGGYYLYFASHDGRYIRLAYADSIEGPWRTHEPGTLGMGQTIFGSHIASPDVHVDDERREIRMYFHGCCLPDPPWQFTCVATSGDGIEFEAREELLGASYWRVFEHGEWYYALEMPGRFRRSREPNMNFEEGPLLFTKDMRHSAVMLRGSTLHVFWSNAGDRPERILHCTIDLRPDWTEWRASDAVTLLEPETDYEGEDLPLEASERGAAPGRARQLRDPSIYEEGGRTYLLYSVAGEHGIAIAEIAEGDRD